MICGACGTENPAEARFCFWCGSRFSISARGGIGRETAEHRSQSAIASIEPATPASEPESSDSSAETRIDGDNRRPALRAVGPPWAPRGFGFAGPENRYELIEVIGQGGMGEVYRALDQRLGRIVALKRMRGVAAGEESFDRFEREARNFAQMQHPNIATLYDFGRDARGPFLVMELVEGEALSRILARGQMLPSKSVPMFLAICAGVSHAHSKSVVHRDIKPSNIIAASDGTPKLVDFGLARAEFAQDATHSGHFVGTLDYAAPEQRRGLKSVDHRADIYSLGATLYQLLSGLHPAPLHLPKLNTVWQSIVARACEPNPALRYQTVDDLAAAVSVVPLEGLEEAAAQAMEPVERLACPACGSENGRESDSCSRCGTNLLLTCPACGKPTRTGLKECLHCNADAALAEAASNRRESAMMALKDRRLYDALGDFAVLEFLLNRPDVKLGATAQWLEWMRQEAQAAKAALDRACLFAQEGRDFEQHGRLTDAVERMKLAQDLDRSFAMEYLTLQEKRAKTESARSVSPVPEGPPARTPPAPPVKTELVGEAVAVKADLRVRCESCGARFFTYHAYAENIKVCPICGERPFKYKVLN